MKQSEKPYQNRYIEYIESEWDGHAVERWIINNYNQDDLEEYIITLFIRDLKGREEVAGASKIVRWLIESDFIKIDDYAKDIDFGRYLNSIYGSNDEED